MKNLKKRILGLTAGMAALCACAIAASHSHVGSNLDNNLLTANLEALTEEAEFHASTSWNCSGTPVAAQCNAKCGVCGSTVSGCGELTGTHNCNISR